MNPAPPPPQRLPRRHQALDFTRRTYALRELLDEPCTYHDYARANLDLARVNHLTRGYDPILNFLERTIARTGVSHEPRHLVDLGAGHADLLRTILRWAAPRSIPLRLTAVDAHPYAGRLARAADRQARIPSGTITHLTADLFTATLAKPADIFLCTLVAHHLPDDDVVRLLQHMATAREGFFLLDLRRSERAAKIFSVLGTLFRWHPMIRHDGPVSFARAFSLEEWQSLITRAGIQATIHDLGRGRLAITSREATQS